MSDLIVVDASVATSWIAQEDISDLASLLLASGAELIAPDLLVAEVGNALWKAERRGAVTAADVAAASGAISRAIAVLHPTLELLPMASVLAREFSHPIYDCFYLALALREDAEVVTADARMAALCRQKGIAVRLIAPPQPSSSA